MRFFKYKFPLYSLRGPVSIIHVRFRIYSVLRFNKFFQIQTRFIFYVAWGPMCIFFGYCGHSSNFAFWALPFLFPTNDIVILCVIWWGPVSISYSLCDMVGACVYKFFHHPILYTNLLYALIVWEAYILRYLQIQICLVVV